MTLKQFFGPADMTTGRPWEKILIFTLPMLLGNIAQQLYATVDSIVVGRYVGDNALAAVGSASPIFNLLLVLFMGISMGAGVLVAQNFGARDRVNLSKTIGNCITITAIASGIIMVVGAIGTRPLLELLDTPASIIDWCADYLLILSLGCAGTAYYNILCGVLRGLGDSVSALIYLLVATVCNIVLDLLFVAVFQMGVAGVALATILAQILSSILCMRKLLKMRHLFDLDKSQLALSKKHTMRIIQLGLPSGLTQAVFSMASILVQSLTNSFGEMVIAANVIIMRVDGFAMMPNFSFGNAMTTFSGQNVGAGRMDRVEQGSRQGLLMAVLTSATITAALLFVGPTIMGIFTETAALVDLSTRMMRILAAGYIAMAVTQSLSGVMRGAGDTMTPMWISMCTTVAIRVPLAYAIAHFTTTAAAPNGNYRCIWISLLTSWCMGALLTTVAYLRGKWKNKSGRR